MRSRHGREGIVINTDVAWEQQLDKGRKVTLKASGMELRVWKYPMGEFFFFFFFFFLKTPYFFVEDQLHSGIAGFSW